MSEYNKKVLDLDETTGLLNRDRFVDQFRTKPQRTRRPWFCGLIRIQGLADMNREYGRQSIDNLLKDIGSSLRTLNNIDKYGPPGSIGRMNGADVCAIASNETNGKTSQT